MSNTYGPGSPAPQWLVRIAKKALRALKAPCPCHPVYHVNFVPPALNPHAAWCLQVSGAVIEVYGGPSDGSREIHPVNADLSALIGVFRELKQFVFDGPSLGQIRLKGMIGQREVVIEILTQPNPHMAPAFRKDGRTGQLVSLLPVEPPFMPPFMPPEPPEAPPTAGEMP